MNGSDSPACGSSDVGIAEQAASSQPQVIHETASDTDTSSSGEEDDEEPRLKYSRLALSEDVFAKDQASALAVSDRILALGTQNGCVVVLDLQGNVVKKTKLHTAFVFALSIDSSSQFIGSAALDGKVIVQNLGTAETQTFDMQRPMRALALDPDYGKHSTCEVITGGMSGLLVLHERGWLGQKEVTLHAGEGPIWSISRRGSLIAWANDESFRIYDLKSNSMIGHFPRDQQAPEEEAPRADLFRCSFVWKNNRELVVAWADYIKVVHIKEQPKSRAVPGIGVAAALFGEVAAIFQVDCMIAGLTLHEHHILILAYPSEDGDDDDEAPLPELRLISNDGEELSSDALSIPNSKQYQCHDYLLSSFIPPQSDTISPNTSQDQTFYVVTPKDVIEARSRDAADHVLWLVEHELYAEALQAVEQSGLSHEKGFDVLGVGLKYLYHLLDIGDYERAASQSPTILGHRQQQWEDWVFAFIEHDQIQTIFPFVPTSNPQLSRLVYEMILGHLVRHDAALLRSTVANWPKNVYETPSIVSAVLAQLEESPGDEDLVNVVADLYMNEHHFGKALPYCLELRRPGVIDLVLEHNLFAEIQDRVLQLLVYDRETAKKRGKQPLRDGDKAQCLRQSSRHGVVIQLLAENTHSVPIAKVVSQLSEHREFLYMYLDALYDKDPNSAPDYADIQVELYAEYEVTKLLGFLRVSGNYHLGKAHQVCERRDLINETVFLLGRMGNNKQALTLIIERLADVSKAIEFARIQNDPDLWEDLLKYSESRPVFIKGILESAGTEVNPVALIKRIKDGLEIPGLRDSLVKVLQDFNLQITLLEGCQDILQSDCRRLSDRFMGQQKKAFLGGPKTSCAGCGKLVFNDGTVPSRRKDIHILFLCRHVFHSACAFPSADANIPSIGSKALEDKSLGLLDQDYDGPQQSVMERQTRAGMRFIADLRSQRRVACPSCTEA